LPEQNPYALDRSLGFLVHRLAETLEARLMSRLARDSLNLPAYRVMAVLLQQNECRSVDLAEQAAIEPTTLSRLISTMRERGLVNRRRSGTDARAVRIWLTRKGRSLAEKLTAMAEASEREILKALPPAQTQIVLQALVKLREAAAANMSQTPTGIRKIKSQATRPGSLLRG
jgi:DNA-binding MarR family transcriptional regulator